MAEHNIQIGVSIDEDSIRQTIINGAAKEIRNSIFPNGFTSRTFYGNDWSSAYKTMMETLTEKFLKENRDGIIDAVAEIVAERVMKSNAMKKAVVDKAISNCD